MNATSDLPLPDEVLNHKAVARGWITEDHVRQLAAPLIAAELRQATRALAEIEHVLWVADDCDDTADEDLTLAQRVRKLAAEAGRRTTPAVTFGPDGHFTLEENT